MFRITALCVDKVQKGKGIRKKLVSASEGWYKENNCSYPEVTSGLHREKEAHLFYLNFILKIYEG